jgi:hypothetical protein
VLYGRRELQRSLRLVSSLRGDNTMVHWVGIHWFELSALVLLIANLWLVSKILETMRETSRWLDFLSVRWDQLMAFNGTKDAGADSQSDLSDRE